MAIQPAALRASVQLIVVSYVLAEETIFELVWHLDVSVSKLNELLHDIPVTVAPTPTNPINNSLATVVVFVVPVL